MSRPAPQKVSLSTGIAGQDGLYKAEFLLEKCFVVRRIRRRANTFNTSRVDRIYRGLYIDGCRFVPPCGDVIDSSNLGPIVQLTQPDENYNSGAQRRMELSFESPEHTADADAMGNIAFAGGYSATLNFNARKPDDALRKESIQ